MSKADCFILWLPHSPLGDFFTLSSSPHVSALPVPCELSLPKSYCSFFIAQCPQLTEVLILSHPAAACRNATASHSGLSSTLARCQNYPPLLCKCVWPWLWPGVLGRVGDLHVAVAATALCLCSAGWRSVASRPEPPSLPCSWLLHVPGYVSCEFSAVLWVGLESMWVLELWHRRGILPWRLLMPTSLCNQQLVAADKSVSFLRPPPLWALVLAAAEL